MPLSNFARARLITVGKFARLHTGDPGPDCTANLAAQSLRVPVIFDGANLNTSTLQWPLCPAAETFTHVSLWDAAGPDDGNPWIYGALAAPGTVAVNQLFEIAAGKLQVNLK